MRIKIYLKGNAEETPKEHELYYGELKRLTHDFREFLRTGSPNHGIYRCYSGKIIAGVKRTRELVLQFEEISIIG